MTTSLRICRLAAACSFAPALLAGCANSSQFTAGRLPYGGERTASSEGSPQDPFLAQGREGQIAQPTNGMPGQLSGTQGFVQGASGSGPAYGPAQQSQTGFAPPAGMPPQGADSHQAAYLQQQAANPFIQASATAPQFGSQAEWANFETPAVPAESNPFADIEGQPAVTRGGAVPSSPSGSLPQITPAGGSTDAWESTPALTSQESEEFLPPAR